MQSPLRGGKKREEEKKRRMKPRTKGRQDTSARAFAGRVTAISAFASEGINETRERFARRRGAAYRRAGDGLAHRSHTKIAQ